jgi:hypothetical protein
MDLTQRINKNESIIFREEEDGGFLFDPETGNLRYINHTAREAFLLLEGETQISNIAQWFHGSYPEIDEKDIEKDLISLFKELEENGFISVITPREEQQEP